MPPHKSVKSVYNITCERGWRPIWEKELANVHHMYSTGKIAAGFHPEDPIHEFSLYSLIALSILNDVFQRRVALALGNDYTKSVGCHFA
jgi:hypothetical protein